VSGTETDGSIVCPSSVNGVAGLKPTVGNVPKQYVIPISEAGEARTVPDQWVALSPTWHFLYGVLSATSPPEQSCKLQSIAAATNWRTGNPETGPALRRPRGSTARIWIQRDITGVGAARRARCSKNELTGDAGRVGRWQSTYLSEPPR